MDDLLDVLFRRDSCCFALSVFQRASCSFLVIELGVEEEEEEFEGGFR